MHRCHPTGQPNRSTQRWIPPDSCSQPRHHPSWWRQQGGCWCPLNRNWLQIDQLLQWGLPIVLVAKSGLGTLNHTLLSLEALRQRGLTILGLILNGPRHPDNPRTLEQLGKVPVLAELPPLEPLSAAGLEQQWHQQNLATKFKALHSCSSQPA